MNWFISAAILITVATASIIVNWKKFYWESFCLLTTSTLSFVLTVAVLITIPVNYCEGKQAMATFELQKEYIESHVAKSEVENAAITVKKIELNEWLYTAQYSEKNYGGWALYPNGLMEIKPIE